MPNLTSGNYVVLVRGEERIQSHQVAGAIALHRI